MSRYLEIESCEDCRWYSERLVTCDHRLGPDKLNPYNTAIPYNCPLPNAPQEGAHCADTPKEKI